ncbi:MAG TPA: tetratricopeptide repeat protein [Allosphingosinicella sp.]|jgi:tetratricopeptide (TPR) repeat protein|nr:tetratricopeptide repeat protein [Allosphingosinicella sp.]
MSIGRTLIAVALAATAVPAGAAVTVLGSTSARMCFEAADARVLPAGNSVDRCNEALAEENLSDYDTVATFVNRGILKMRLGNSDAAIADFDKALARDPNQPEAYLNKGIALLRKPDGWTQAVPLFDSALAKKTRRPALAYYGRGVANELAGHVKQAYYDYREASRIEPNWRDPRQELTRFTVSAP